MTIKGNGHLLEANLLDNRLARAAFRSRLYPGLPQAVTALVFTLVLAELVAGPGNPQRNFGTAMTWVLWWPIIPLLFLGLGRFWCAVCPFATLSDLVQRVVGHNRPVPAFLKRYGIWIIDAFFIAITWADHVVGIVESPRGSGILLMLLILGVVTAGAFFERRTWCRYLCFLGGLSGNYSRAGMMELRATPGKCARCNAQACFKGGEKAPGCPMFEFPRTMDTNARCNLCGHCVKNCPNDSVRLSVRVPTKELWSIRRPKLEEAFLACVIMGVVFVQNITMLAIWGPIFAWLERVLRTDNFAVPFSVLFALIMALPIVALFGASWAASRRGNGSVVAAFTAFGYALIPLDLAGHLAHNLFHLLAEGRSIVFTALSLVGKQSWGSAALLDASSIRSLQYLLVLLGVAGSAYTAYRIAKSRSTGTAAGGAGHWLPIVALIVVLGGVNLVLFYLPMVTRL